VLNHPFFENLNLDLLLKKQLNPPYKPEIKELEYFDQNLLKSNNVNMSIIPKPNLDLIN